MDKKLSFRQKILTGKAHGAPILLTDLLPKNWPRIRYDFGRLKGNEITTIAFNSSRTYWAVFRGVQYTDSVGDEHAYFWWDKIWSTVYLFGGSPFVNPTEGDPRVHVGGGNGGGGSKPSKAPAPSPVPTCEGGQGDINLQLNPLVVGYTGGVITNGN